MGLKLNDNHWWALFFTVLAWVFGWYALVLITAKFGDPVEDKFPLKPTTTQYYGLGFSIGIGILVWIKNVYAIQGDTEQQDGG